MNRDYLESILINWKYVSSDAEFQEVTSGATHKTFRIFSGKSRYYLRVYRYADELRIKREHNLINRLIRTNIPCVKLKTTNDNSTFFKHDDKYFALFEEASGKQLKKEEFEDAHIKESAETLAELHLELKNISSEDYFSIPLNWNGDLWAKRFDLIIKSIVDKGVENNVSKISLSRAKAQQTWLLSPDCCHQYMSEYPSQIIHGDYHHLNLFFDENKKVSGIIDWDTAVLMPRAYEIIRACAFMFDMNILLSKLFITTYLNYNPIDMNELNDGAKAWGCFSDHHVWPLEETYINDNLSASAFIPSRKFRPFIDEWIELKNEL